MFKMSAISDSACMHASRYTTDEAFMKGCVNDVFFNLVPNV